MKPQSIIVAILLVCRMTHAQDICHFTKVEIPRAEARLLELARVFEFRSECVLPQVDGSDRECRFIAERYQQGKCISRQSFSLAKYSNQELSEGRYRGFISFGWHMDDQKLVGVHDTGYFHETGFAKLPDFDSDRPRIWAFFKDSRAEPRASNSGRNFDLYPILGIRGPEPLTLNGVTQGRIGDIYSLPSEQLVRFFKDQLDAVIVYLSFGVRPDLDYDNK